LDVVDGLVIEQVLWNNLLDNVLDDLTSQVLSGDLLSVLSGDDNGVNSEWDDGTLSKRLFQSTCSMTRPSTTSNHLVDSSLVVHKVTLV
jgi:hypothetical protein